MIYVDLDNVEQVYLLEAVERLHHDNVSSLNSIYAANNEGSYSREDVLSLMKKEASLYEHLKAKIGKGL